MNIHQSQRLDAADTIFLSNQLEQRRLQALDKHYPELKGRLLVPIGRNYHPGVEIISYEMYDMVGIAKIIANYATDFRKVDIRASEHFGKVKTLGDSTEHSYLDLDRSSLAGKPVLGRRVEAARRAILLAEDSIIAFGDEEHDLVGLLNHPNIPDESAIDIGGSVTEWENKTAEQIVDDLMLGENTVMSQSSYVEVATDLVLPPTSYTIADGKKMPYSEKTALEWYRGKSQTVRNVTKWHHLETAGDGGSKRAMFYRADPGYLEHPVSVEFRAPLGPEQSGGVIKQIYDSRVGGVHVFYPLSALYLDGI